MRIWDESHEKKLMEKRIANSARKRSYFKICCILYYVLIGVIGLLFGEWIALWIK
jgi:hypothetical protein